MKDNKDQEKKEVVISPMYLCSKCMSPFGPLVEDSGFILGVCDYCKS